MYMYLYTYTYVCICITCVFRVEADLLSFLGCFSCFVGCVCESVRLWCVFVYIFRRVCISASQINAIICPRSSPSWPAASEVRAE